MSFRAPYNKGLPYRSHFQLPLGQQIMFNFVGSKETRKRSTDYLKGCDDYQISVKKSKKSSGF